MLLYVVPGGTQCSRLMLPKDHLSLHIPSSECPLELIELSSSDTNLK